MSGHERDGVQIAKAYEVLNKEESKARYDSLQALVPEQHSVLVVPDISVITENSPKAGA